MIGRFGEEWMNRALCAEEQIDPNVFFPETATIDAAIAVCIRCPVARKCLEFALSFPDNLDFGVWGGTSARERDRIRAQRRQRSQAS